MFVPVPYVWRKSSPTPTTWQENMGKQTKGLRVS